MLPDVAEVVLEEQEPPYVIVPASSEEKSVIWCMSSVGVVTAFTSAITGAVVSVVVEFSSSEVVKEEL